MKDPLAISFIFSRGYFLFGVTSSRILMKARVCSFEEAKINADLLEVSQFFKKSYLVVGVP